MMPGGRIPFLRVNQWLPEWDEIKFSESEHRRVPQRDFFILSMSAVQLKRLSGIQRRELHDEQRRYEDTAIQRRHDAARSRLIHEYVRYGYPWSELPESKRRNDEFADLRQPGWLPTAIVVNILAPGDDRRGRKVGASDLVNVLDADKTVGQLELPKGCAADDWEPSELYPIEVIDGQHRLWAFDNAEIDDGFELPVVAFYGLDLSWQAYLFWSINIKPKRINASLAFDLYPLLRSESWLEKAEGHSVYRESRAQELTEVLWSHPSSPWHHQINMLGEPGLPRYMASQAAWVRALTTTMLRGTSTRSGAFGGLMSAALEPVGEPLPWSRSQQAAFLMILGLQLQESIERLRPQWTDVIYEAVAEAGSDGCAAALVGPSTLLSTDQGLNALLKVSNDVFVTLSPELDLFDWNEDDDEHKEITHESVNQAIASAQSMQWLKILVEYADSVATFDWRNSQAVDDPELRRHKQAFRGSGGYRALREDLVRHLVKETDPEEPLGAACSTLLEGLG